MIRLAAIVVAGGLLSSCARCADTPAVEQVVPEVREVELVGCAAVAAGPVCEIDAETELRLFVPGSPLPVEVDGQAVATQAEATTGGQRERVKPGAGAQVLRVGGWAMTLRARRTNATLERAAALRSEGKGAEAAQTLDAAMGSMDAGAQARARGLLGRIALSESRLEDAVAQLERARDENRSAGQISEACRDGLALTYVLTYRLQRFADAAAALTALEALAAIDDACAARLPRYRGQLAWETGDLRGAMRSLRDAIARADRLALLRPARESRHLLAWTLSSLGRGADARAQVEAIVAGLEKGASPCERGQALNTQAWIALLERERDPSADGDFAPLLKEAVALFRGACESPTFAGAALVNLALDALQRGDAKAATAYLDEAEAAHDRPDLSTRLWQLELRGRTALAAGDAGAALERFRRLGALGASAFLPEYVWRGALGRGRALLALGRKDAAVAAFAEAEAALEAEALRVPVGEGRDSFSAARERGVRWQLEAALGAPDDAMGVVRRARARSLATLQWFERIGGLPPKARAQFDAAIGRWRQGRAKLDAEAAGDWGLSEASLAAAKAERARRAEALREDLDEAARLAGAAPQRRRLRPPKPGEVIAAWHPLPGGDWAALVQDASGARAQRVAVPERITAEALAQRLLAAIGERIAAAKQMRVLPYGALRAVDFHALPLGDGLLIDRLALSYGLDLSVSEVVREAGGPSLIVADTRGDLPNAREEGAQVHAALGPDTTVLLQNAAATREAVLAGFANARLFHFAGHGEFAGRGGWESVLPLGGGAVLTPGDVLALERVPPRIVLSGCELGRSSEALAVESLGLAQAFVVAGAGAVVAPVRRVRDETARLLSELLYRAGTDDLAMALRSAQIALRAQKGKHDWSAFRVFVP